MFGKLFSKSQTHKFNYKEPDIGSKKKSEYGGELVVACVTGMSGIGQVEKLDDTENLSLPTDLNPSLSLVPIISLYINEM